MRFNAKRVSVYLGLTLFISCVILFIPEKNFHNLQQIQSVHRFLGVKSSGWNKQTLKQTFKDIECRPKNLSFLNASHPNFKSQVCIVSYPGSGNTWVRHLLQEATGYYTGSMYSDLTLLHNGFPGEKNRISAGDCIAYKTHVHLESKTDRIDQCRKVVMLIRNPFDAIVAVYHMNHGHGTRNQHVAVANAGQFETTGWYNSVKSHILQWWETLAWKCTNDFKGPLHLIFYEDMKVDAMKAMAEVLEFLQIQPIAKDLWCMYQNGEGQNHRKMENGTRLRGIYRSADVQLVRTIINIVSSMIKTRLPE